MLVAGYYSYSWVEATHVLTLMVSIGTLFIIDLRMLGLLLPNVPAMEIAARLHKPMIFGFIVMFITGFLLYYAKPVETTQSLWFRIKMVLLLLAFINAYIFNSRLKATSSQWEHNPEAPGPLKKGAIISLILWCSVITMGRYIPYDWVDCRNTSNETLLWAAGCVEQLQTLK